MKITYKVAIGLGVVLLAGFGTHAPERITTAFNPISSAGDVKEVFVVYWFYLPGCEKRPEDTVSKPIWFTPEGKQCFGGKSVNVTLNESLLPEKLEISDLW